MTESVSTTTVFQLPIDEIIQEAIDTLGGENQSGYDTVSAIRSLNLLLIDLSNRGYPLGHLEKRSISFVVGQSEYTLGADVLAIVDANFKDSNNESPMANLAFLDYFNLSNKDTRGRPSQYCFDRTTDPPKLRVYPTPDQTGTSFDYWVVRRHKDINKLYQIPDLSHRYLPAITMGLSYFLAFKKQGVDPSYITFLKTEYTDRLEAAFMEDSDHFDFVVYPFVSQR
jgi:hypothetical protein